jgi:HSP20 family protein
LADVVTSDKEVKVVVEVPGIDKKDIKINAYHNSVEISTVDTSQSIGV